MWAPGGVGVFGSIVEAIDAVLRLWRRAQHFAQAMRSGVEAGREAARIGGGIVEDADQRLITLGSTTSTRMSRLPAAFASEMMPAFSIFSMSVAARL